MKIYPHYYQHMKEKMSHRKDEIPLLRQHFSNMGNIKSVEKAVRWQLMQNAGLLPFLCEKLYRDNDLDDSHIDTALRKIMKEIEHDSRL